MRPVPPQASSCRSCRRKKTRSRTRRASPCGAHRPRRHPCEVVRGDPASRRLRQAKHPQTTCARLASSSLTGDDPAKRRGFGMARFKGLLIATAAMLVLVLGTSTLAQAPAPTSPAFTAAQADAGRAAYAQQCAACHGEALQGGQFGPTLKGKTFQNKWGGAPLGELYAYIRRS